MTTNFEQLDPQRKGIFKETIINLASGQPSKGEITKVTIDISGGPPSERYEYRVEVYGNRRARYKFIDELNNIPTEEYSTDLSHNEISEVFQQLNISGILELPQKDYQILPDSLIGSITIDVGDMRKKVYFPVKDGEDPLIKQKEDFIPISIAEGTKLRANSQEIPEAFFEIFEVASRLAKRVKTKK